MKAARTRSCCHVNFITRFRTFYIWVSASVGDEESEENGCADRISVLAFVQLLNFQVWNLICPAELRVSEGFVGHRSVPRSMNV